MWWVGFARTAAAVAAGAALGLVPAPAAADDGSSPSPTPADQASFPGFPRTGAEGGTSNEISLTLDEEGVLHAEETISLGAEPPGELTRTLTTRTPYDADRDRLYDVTGVRVEDANGDPIDHTTHEEDGTLDVRMDTSGTTKVVLSYRVHGATDTVGDRAQVEYPAVAGYSVPIDETAVVVSASTPPTALSCTAGEPRGSIYCTSSDMGGHQAAMARFLQTDLGPGERLNIVVSYPADAAPGTLTLERTWSLTSAFAITPQTASAFGAVLAVLVGGLVALIRLRGRDERAIRTEASAGDNAPLAPDEPGGMRFRPPDGVHPGQIGTLIDEQADVIDITATVVDLAVRGHFGIRELPHEHFSAIDWAIDRRPPPEDDELLPYEALLIDALFHDSEDGTVRVSQLGESGFPARLSGVRDELYRDMVRLRWFAYRPNLERNRWTTAGIALTAAGVGLTVLLALYTQAAFTGLAVIIAGAAVTLGAQYMPAKTSLGSVVFAHTLGFRAYLLSAGAEDAPAGCRVQLFSRYLPYAIIFDNVEHWARILASAGSDELDGDALPWYEGPEEWRLADFTDSIRSFTLTLTGVISNTRQFRTLD